MQTSTAFLAGAGTIVVALGIGLGGGFIAANIMNPKTPKGAEVSKLEQRMAPDPAAPADASKPAVQAETPKPAAQAEASSPPVAPAPKTVPNVPLGAPLAAAQPEPAPRSAPPLNAEPGTTTGTAPARASDDNVKRAADAEAKARAADADAKKHAAEQRRAERHQRWVEQRRRYQARRDQDRHDADRKARDDGGYRDAFGWNSSGDDAGKSPRDAGSRNDSRDDARRNPPRFELPQVRLFDADSDD
jgi:hypothetical protein